MFRFRTSDFMKTIHTNWKGIHTSRLLILDNCIVSSFLDGDQLVVPAFRALLSSGWGLLYPTPAMYETHQRERNPSSSPIAREWAYRFDRNRSAISSMPSLETSILARKITLEGAGFLHGFVTTVNPDIHNWTGLAYNIRSWREGAKQRAKGQEDAGNGYRKFLIDWLVLMMAQNLFCGVWTNNAKDFNIAQSTQEWRRLPWQQVPILSSTQLYDYSVQESEA